MRKFVVLFSLLVSSTLICFSQTNIFMSNQTADEIIHGNYDPVNYTASQIVNHPDSILTGIVNEVSEDSLQSFLEYLETFHNRNTGSDTISNTTGIGAARRW